MKFWVLLNKKGIYLLRSNGDVLRFDDATVRPSEGRRSRLGLSRRIRADATGRCVDELRSFIFYSLPTRKHQRPAAALESQVQSLRLVPSRRSYSKNRRKLCNAAIAFLSPYRAIFLEKLLYNVNIAFLHYLPSFVSNNARYRTRI